MIEKIKLGKPFISYHRLVNGFMLSNAFYEGKEYDDYTLRELVRGLVPIRFRIGSPVEDLIAVDLEEYLFNE